MEIEDKQSKEDVERDSKQNGASRIKMMPLADDFQPGPCDVICARGKKALEHSGNLRFKELVVSLLKEYSKASTKIQKGVVVTKIVEAVRKASPDGGFVRYRHGVWYEVGDHIAREKIGQALRDALHPHYKSSTKAKQEKKKLKKADRKASNHDISLQKVENLNLHLNEYETSEEDHVETSLADDVLEQIPIEGGAAVPNPKQPSFGPNLIPSTLRQQVPSSIDFSKALTLNRKPKVDKSEEIRNKSLYQTSSHFAQMPIAPTMSSRGAQFPPSKNPFEDEYDQIEFMLDQKPYKQGGISSSANMQRLSAQTQEWPLQSSQKNHFPQSLSMGQYQQQRSQRLDGRQQVLQNPLLQQMLERQQSKRLLHQRMHLRIQNNFAPVLTQESGLNLQHDRTQGQTQDRDHKELRFQEQLRQQNSFESEDHVAKMHRYQEIPLQSSQQELPFHLPLSSGNNVMQQELHSGQTSFFSDAIFADPLAQHYYPNDLQSPELQEPVSASIFNTGSDETDEKKLAARESK